MAPKKEAAPKGPTVEEIELEWKQKRAVWEDEERRLIGSVEDAISEDKFLKQKVSVVKEQISKLQYQSADIIRTTDDKRVQFFQQARQATDIQERDLATVVKQTSDIEMMQEKIASQRKEVREKNSVFDQAATTNEHHLALIQKRNSLTSMLKERLVKLRSESVQVEARLLETISQVRESKDLRNRRKTVNYALIVGSKTATMEICSAELRDVFGFDVRYIEVPTAHALLFAMVDPVVPLVAPHVATLTLGTGSASVAPYRPSGLDSATQQDPATSFLDDFSTALLEMSQGHRGEQRCIVSICAQAAPGSTDGQSLMFSVAVLSSDASTNLTAQEAQRFSTIVSCKEILQVCLGEQALQKNVLLMLEVTLEDTSKILYLGASGTPLAAVHVAATPEANCCGRPAGILLSALTSIVSKECLWTEIDAERVATKLLMESRSIFPELAPAMKGIAVPIWAQLPNLEIRPMSRASEKSDKHDIGILPPAALAPLLSPRLKFFDVSFFIPSSSCSKLGKVAASDLFSPSEVRGITVAPGASTVDVNLQDARFLDFLVVFDCSPAVVVEAIRATLMHTHRVHHAGFDDLGPALAITCISSSRGLCIVRISVAGNAASLDDATRCRKVLRGSDRTSWSELATPYSVLDACVLALSDSLPDARRFTRVTEVRASVCCSNTVAQLHLLRRLECTATLSSESLDAVFAKSPQKVIPMAPFARTRTSYVPLKDVEVAGSFHRYEMLKQRGEHSLLQQQLFCLVVHDGDKSATELDQHGELHKAHGQLVQQIPLAHNMVFAHIDITSGLSCSRDELVSMSTSSGGKAAADGSDEKFADKRAAWGALMGCLPPPVVDFLARVTYPCLVLSSPCFKPGERSMLVLPRNLQSICPRTSRCMFKSEQVVTAVAYFVQELMWHSNATNVTAPQQAAHPQMESWIVL